MTRHLKIDEAAVVAFSFTEREKDYGGIHLGVPRASIEALLALTDELVESHEGHSRSLRLRLVPNGLPQRIFARSRYRPLASLRIGTAVDSVTRIHSNSQAGIITLSPHGVAEFKSAIMLVQGSHGDLLIAGDSGSWIDRLWFWTHDPQ